MGNEQGDEDNRGKPYQEKDEMKLWGIFVFALIGATATTFAPEKFGRLHNCEVQWILSTLS